MDPTYIQTPGNIATPYEWKYFRAGFFLILSGPIQLLFFHIIVMESDMDIVAIHPIAIMLALMLPSIVLQTIGLTIAAGGYQYAKHMNETLGITRIPLFAFHAGILMVSRIIFILLVRTLSGNYKFRLNEPYILWTPDI